MVKYSRTKGFPRGFVYSEKTGFRFMKDASARNRCIGSQLRGKTFGNRDAQQEAWNKAQTSCRGKK